MDSGCEEEGDVGSYIINGFMVRLKGRTGERYHLTQVASTMGSGIEVRKLIVLLLLALVNKGTNKGSMF